MSPKKPTAEATAPRTASRSPAKPKAPAKRASAKAAPKAAASTSTTPAVKATRAQAPKRSASATPKHRVAVGESVQAARPKVVKKAAGAVRTATAGVTKSPAKRAAKATSKAKKGAATPLQRLMDAVREALVDLKALSVIELDVRGQSDVTDSVVIASGTSDRHVKSIAERVRIKARAAGFRILGTEGEREGEWVLIDLGDVIVHVMLPRVRELYALERLWSVRAEER